MLGCQFQGFSGKSAHWCGGAGTVRGTGGKLAGQGPVSHLACLVLLTHARALHQDLCHTSQWPPEAQTAQGSQPFHPDLNSGLGTPPSVHLTFFFFFAKMSPAK